MDAGYVWDDNAYTTKDGTKPGMYFGTSDISIAKADQDKYVFLPAAGYRYGTIWSNVGSNGYYWSSTLTDGNACNPLFGNGYCFFDYSNLIRGFSVRCIRDK